MNRIYSSINQVSVGNRTWLNRTAKWLRIKGISSNQLSFVGLLLSFISGFNFYFAFHGVSFWLRGVLLLTAALCIQGRLICNVLDGLIAGDSTFMTSSNPISSLVYERISDSAIFIGLGLGLTQMPTAMILGWLAALLSILTAYVRFLDAAFNLKYSALKKPTKQYSLVCLCGCSIVASFLPKYTSQLLLYGCLLFMIIAFIFLCFLHTKKTR